MDKFHFFFPFSCLIAQRLPVVWQSRQGTTVWAWFLATREASSHHEDLVWAEAPEASVGLGKFRISPSWASAELHHGLLFAFEMIKWFFIYIVTPVNCINWFSMWRPPRTPAVRVPFHIASLLRWFPAEGFCGSSVSIFLFLMYLSGFGITAMLVTYNNLGNVPSSAIFQKSLCTGLLLFPP